MALGFFAESSPADDRPNFLFLVVDDLNDYVGCLGGHPDAHTPHIDALAARGVLFTNAHCNSPVCNPSRASLWSGLRPTTTKITTNPSGWFRDTEGLSDVVTLPQALSKAGYSTTGFGKLFHLGHNNLPWPDWQQHRNYGYGPLLSEHLNYQDGDRLSDWGVPPSGKEMRRGPQPSRPEMASFDEDIARRAIEFLADERDRPFFLGCGFYRPHTPLYAPQKWFDRFPLDEVDLPETRPDDNDDLPYFGTKPRREQDIEAPGLWNHEWVEKTENWRAIVRAYLASTSYVDEQIGRVVEAWEKSRFAESTYLVLFSDHGWHLGEKNHWGKAALWEQTTRIPLIVVGPKLPQGAICDEPVELIDLYPTLLDLAAVKASHRLEGASLRPLFEDPALDTDRIAWTTFSDHHAIRDDRFRYILYEDGSEELYDLSADPHEFDNLASSNPPELLLMRTRLQSLLPLP